MDNADTAAVAARLESERKDQEALAAQVRWQQRRGKGDAVFESRVQQRLIEEEARSAYGSALTWMRALQVCSWIGAVVMALKVAWWCLFIGVAAHVVVQIYTVLCDISVQLRRRDH
jgi:Flp pilus assembly protein TadB